MTAFIPRFISERYVRGQRHGTFKTAAMFIDIVGLYLFR